MPRHHTEVKAGLLALGILLAGSLVAGQRNQAPTSSPASSGSSVLFQNIASAAGLDFVHTNGASADKHLVETMGSGGLFFDFDNDGWIDVFLVDGGSLADRQVAARARHRLFRNRQNGTFEDVTAKARIRHSQYGMGACAADYDNDGFDDLYITNLGPNVLYHNNGDGTFDDVTQKAGVGSSLWSTSCAFADFDNDGRVDLFITNYVDATAAHNKFCGDPTRRLRVYCHPLNYKPLPNVLYHNNGDGTFSDVSAQAGIGSYRGNGLGVVVADYDDDGWPDVFVANDTMPNFLFHNESKGVFREVGLLAGVAVANDGKARAGMGTDFGDYDGDGLLDLVVTNHEFESTSLYRNLGGGLFAESTVESGIGPPTLPYVGFGAVFMDYDNDGRLDLAIVNGHVVDNTAQFRPSSSYAQRRLLFRNTGNRHFSEVSRSAGPGFGVEKVGRTLAAGDIDNDGDLDLLVTNTGQAADLLRNDGGNRGSAIQIRLTGKRSNHDGIGAKLQIKTGTTTHVRYVKAGSSYVGQNDMRVHVGVGDATQIDRLDVRWPSGQMDTATRVPVNSIVTVVEGEGVSRRVPFSVRK